MDKRVHKIREQIKEQRIRQLNERDRCRKKVHVWFGSKTNHMHPVNEALANIQDEVVNNFDSGIMETTLDDDDRTITFRDTGRGIPLEQIDEETGKPMWELLLMTLFAGGKYDEEDEFTTGTNGCGLTVTQYCSDYFEIISKRNGNIYRMVFEDGGLKVSPLEIIGETKETGTTLKFRLSDKVFTNTKINIEDVKKIVERICSTTNKITGIVNYKNERQVYHFNSMNEYFEKYSKGLKSSVLEGAVKEYETKFVDMEEGEEKTEISRIQVIFASTSEEPFQETFLNSTYLPQRGTIYDGVVQGMRNYINKHLTDNKMFDKGEKSITTKDVELAISFVCNYLSSEVEFEGQTKFLTKKELYQEIAKNYMIEQLEILSNENKADMEKIAKQVLVAMRARIKSSKMMDNVMKKLTEGITIFNRPEGLLNCINKDPLNNRIFIAEGRSAKTGLAQGRDKYTDAIIAIRGKILNCLKADWIKIFKNEIVLDLVRILGCGVSVKTKENKEFVKFDRSKLKYGQVIIATDSDVDGMNIRCLLLTMFYVLMPELFGNEEEGIESVIYIVEAPLFEIECGGEIYTAITEEEKDEIIKSLGNKKYVVNRNKGLGEMDGDLTAKTIMNPEYEGLYRVTMKDMKKAIEHFELFMGENVAPRKQYILDNFEQYANIADVE